MSLHETMRGVMPYIYNLCVKIAPLGFCTSVLLFIREVYHSFIVWPLVSVHLTFRPSKTTQAQGVVSLI